MSDIILFINKWVNNILIEIITKDYIDGYHSAAKIILEGFPVR